MADNPELGKAYVQIVPSAKGIRGSIASALDPEAQSAGESAGSTIAGKIKGMIAAAGIGTALVTGIKATLNEGAALEQSLGGIETLFKDSADTMKKYAADAYKTAGLSANEYMEQATSFAASLIASTGGDTAKAAEIANMALVDMSDNANKMGTDIGRIQDAYQGFARGNYTMLDNLKLGYSGTKQEMARLLEDAEKLTGVHYDMNNLSDVYNAIHAIQENLDITGTTAKEAASTFSGSFESMKAAAQNLLGNIAIGADIGPSLEALLTTTKTFVFNNFIPMLFNIVKAVPGAVIGMLKSTGTELANWIGTIDFDTVMKNFDGFFTQVNQKLQDGLDQAGTFLAKLTFKIGEKGPELIKAGGQIVSHLLSGLSQAAPELISFYSDRLINLTAVIVRNGPQWISAGFELVTNLITGLLKGIPGMIRAVGDGLEQFVDYLTTEDWGKAGSEMMTAIIDGIRNMITNIGQVCGEIWEAFTSVDWLGLGGQLISAIWQGITEAWPVLSEALGTALSGLMQYVQEHWPEWLQAGVDLLGQIAQGITTGISMAIDAFGQFAAQCVTWLQEFDWAGAGRTIMDLIINGLTALGDLLTKIGECCVQIWQAFTSVDWLQLGKDLITSIVNGIASMLGEMWNAAMQASDQILEQMRQVDWIQLGKDVVHNVIEGLKSFLSNVAAAAAELAGQIMQKIQETDWQQVGRDVVSRLVEGLLYLLSAIAGAAVQLANEFWNTITQTDWIQLGRNIIQGLIDGIGSMGEALWNAAVGSAEGMVEGFKNFLGIHSPSRLMRDEIGKFIPPGIALGIEANADSMTDAMEKAARQTVDVGVNAVSADDIGQIRNNDFNTGARGDSAAVLAAKIDAAVERLEQAFNVVLSINGTQLARATAPDFDKELQRLAVVR